MACTCDTDEERGYLRKFVHTKMEGKRLRGRLRTRWIDQIIKGNEMRGGGWEEIQENKKWENRDGWRFLIKNLSI